MPRRASLLLAAALLALLALAPSAGAASSLESIFQDDAVLLNSGGDVARESLDEMQSLGVDTIHSLVVWTQVAPKRYTTRRPAGFDPSDPADYPKGNWVKYDRLVREANERGIDLILTPSTPVPAWAGDCRTKSRKLLCVNRPKAKEYGAFVAALAKRYSGSYPDPENPGTALPRVRRWSFLNEPNLGAWLTPQYEKLGGRTVATGVRIARGLIYAGIDAMRANGHASDALYMAETAPVGARAGRLDTRKNPPRAFLRALFCLNAGGGSLVDARLGCSRRPRRFQVTGIAHHPYTLGAGAPPFARTGGDDITIGSLGRLTGLLGQAASRGRITRSAAGRIYLNEFGYQTNPPDDNFGVSFEKQAENLNQGDYTAYRTRQVRGLAQYELYDDPTKASFNTGLRLCREPAAENLRDCKGGRPFGARKTSYGAYRLPLYVTAVPRSTKVRVFGWVRPARGPETVELYLLRTDQDDKRLATLTTRATGIVDLVMRRPKGAGVSFQLRWSSGDELYRSRKARIALR